MTYPGITYSVMESGPAALLFSATFLFGEKLHPFRQFSPDRRSLISFASGASSAYVFMHLMPELDVVRHRLLESVETHAHFEGLAIYFLALVGFLIFYGLEHLRHGRTTTATISGSSSTTGAHLGGFAAYVWLISYLLVHQLDESSGSVLLYAIAITCHLLAIDHALRDEHRQVYQRRGRFVLAAMPLLGWTCGLLVSLPDAILAMMTAFISGAIIMNSSLNELPTEKDGRFRPFLLGGILYGLILLPVG